MVYLESLKKKGKVEDVCFKPKCWHVEKARFHARRTRGICSMTSTFLPKKETFFKN